MNFFFIVKVRLSYSKKWKERREGLKKIESILKNVEKSDNFNEYLDSALSIICKLLKDSLFAVIFYSFYII